MKIAVLGSRGIPNRYGGFEEMAERVAPLWVRAGHEVVVYATSDHPEKVEFHEGVRVKHIFNPEHTIGLAGQFIYDYLIGTREPGVGMVEHRINLRIDPYPTNEKRHNSENQNPLSPYFLT